MQFNLAYIPHLFCLYIALIWLSEKKSIHLHDTVINYYSYTNISKKYPSLCEYRPVQILRRLSAPFKIQYNIAYQIYIHYNYWWNERPHPLNCLFVQWNATQVGIMEKNHEKFTHNNFRCSTPPERQVGVPVWWTVATVLGSRCAIQMFTWRSVVGTLFICWQWNIHSYSHYTKPILR